MGMTINLDIPHDRYAEIEEYCVNKAISIPAYFIMLHELNMLHGFVKAHEKSERFNEFHRKFESLAQHEVPSNVKPNGKELASNKETLQDSPNVEKERKTRKKS